MTTLTRNSAQSLSTVALFAAVMAVLGLVPKIDLKEERRVLWYASDGLNVKVRRLRRLF